MQGGIINSYVEGDKLYCEVCTEETPHQFLAMFSGNAEDFFEVFHRAEEFSNGLQADLAFAY